MNTLITLVTALAVDGLFGEPPARFHPVVWMGRLVSALERRAPARESLRLWYGAGLVTVTLTCVGLPAWVVERGLRRLGVAGAVLLGVCLKPVRGARALSGGGAGGDGTGGG